MFHRRRLFIALVLTWIVGVPHCFGQSSAMNGEISGTVTDPAGGSIPNAVVTVTNIATGFRQTAKTGSSGLYRFSLLPLGAYGLETQATRFTAAKRSGSTREIPACPRAKAETQKCVALFTSEPSDSRRDDQLTQGSILVVRWVAQSANIQPRTMVEDAADVTVSAESPLAVVLAHSGISYAAKW